MIIGAKPFRAQAVALLLIGIAAAGPAPASDPFFERTALLAADGRCRLFTAQVSAALKAAAAQARAAALRRGETAQTLQRLEAEARALGARAACGSADLARVKARVEGAFAGWARTARMAFDRWRADRRATGWRIAQVSRTGASPVTFGVTPDGPAAVVSFVGRPRPYAARLVMRDERIAARPWLSGEPPSALTRTVLAGGRGAAEAELLSAGARAGEAWRFPDAAMEALGRLDPRERFAVEFLFRDDSVARARFEVGDLAAAQAFLALGPL